MFRDSKMFLVVAVAVGLCIPLLRLGWFSGHEQYSYVLRTLEWAQEMRAGELYPRWCPDFYGGYGSPLFLFYGPVIYGTAGLLTATFLDPFSALKLVVVVGSVLSGAGTFALIYGETRQRDAALFGALAFLASPYRNGNLYARGDLGEFSCLSLLPVVLALYRAAAHEAQPRRGRWLAVAAGTLHAVMILTHPVLGLWGSLVVGLVVLGSAIGLWASGVWRRAIPLVLAMACAPGLVGVYIVPAIAYRSITHTAGMVVGFYKPQDQWIAFHSLFDTHPIFWPNFLSIGYLVAAACAMSVLVLIIDFKKGRAVLGWMALTFLLVGLTLPHARWFWEPGRVPLSQFIQFPWRLLGPASLTASVAMGIGFAYASERLAEPLKAGLAIAFPTAFLLLVTWPFLTSTELPQTGIPNDPDSIRAGLYSATDANEYLPLGASLPSAPRGELVIKHHGAAVQFTSSDGSRHSLGVNAKRGNAELTLGVYDFPGWKVKTLTGPADAKLVADEQGLLKVQLPVPGEYRLRVSYGASPAGVLGGSLSVLSALALCLIAARGSRFWPLRIPKNNATAGGAT
ncbi:MAG: hypothetical protein WDO74_23890 [Pseudomonadota bacterium]